MLKKIIGNPPLMIIISFFSAICLGTMLLKLPLATLTGISWVDALFTITSATCVTGLTVQDTATYFTRFGQFIILLFIQIGGLGILTLSALFIGAVRGKLGFTSTGWIEDSVNHDFTGDFYYFLKNIMKYVAVIELAGAILLFGYFIRYESIWRSVELAVFHSVSAFCNAGFSLFSNNLESYRGSPAVNGVIMALIVLGGLGFVVLDEITAGLRRKTWDLSFHSKVVLVTTGLLIVFGALGIYLIQDNGRFSDMPVTERILVSLFQSVTCRTAGFNTIALAPLQDATLFIMIILMFIGGSPGSTAGGIKTTSFAIFITLIISRLRGRPRPELGGRTVSKDTVERVLTLILASLLLICICLFLLLISELDSDFHAMQRNSFLAQLFETVSAFGTVGLSMGITPYLTSVGKMIIIILMFVGRVGPLTLTVLMLRKDEVEYEYPEEEIMIG